MSIAYIELIYNHTSSEINAELIQRLRKQFPTSIIYCTPDYVLDPEAADPNVIVWEVRLFIPTVLPDVLIAFIELKRQGLTDNLPVDWISTEVADLDSVIDYQNNYSYWVQL